MSNKSEFSITPDSGSMAGIERDLSFHPADPTQGRTLSREQIEAYDSLRGYTADSP